MFLKCFCCSRPHFFKFSCIKSTSETRLWCKDYSLTLLNSKERYFLSLQKPCCIQVTRTHCYLNSRIAQLSFEFIVKSTKALRCTAALLHPSFYSWYYRRKVRSLHWSLSCHILFIPLVCCHLGVSLCPPEYS